MDAVGADLGETVGNIISCSYKLMRDIQPDALLILGDTNSCLSAISAKNFIYRYSIWRRATAARTSVCRKRQTAV